MTKEEAEEIIEAYHHYEDGSCHTMPPCSKCVESPSEETFKEALEVING